MGTFDYRPLMHTPDAGDVVLLHGISPRHVDGFMLEASRAGAPVVALADDELRLTAKLWHALPPGAQARCHSPIFGLRFRHQGRTVLEASICWQCNNIFGVAEDAAFHREFDGSSQPGTELLALLAAKAGSVPPDALKMLKYFRWGLAQPHPYPEFRQGLELCIQWVELAGQPVHQEHITLFYASLRRTTHHGCGWDELEFLFGRWAAQQGFEVPDSSRAGR